MKSKQQTLGKLTHTERGFELIEFVDIYGEACSLQKSSLADQDAIWLGCEEYKVHHVTNEPLSPRMHLNEQKVRALIGHLKAWLETRSFNKRK